jgi:Na+/H+ antiporter NhaC
MCSYLWYLTPVVIWLAFFGDNVSLKTKAKIVKEMKTFDVKSE